MFNQAATFVVCCARIAGAFLLLTGALYAQKPNKTGKPPRDLIYKVDPQYPLELKRAHIGGMVRLDVLVTPKGTVKTVSVLGGNPVLAETALRAVETWKWAPAESETTVHVNAKFDPDQK